MTGLQGNDSLIAAAHELKTPLIIIAQLAASLKDGLLPADPTQQQLALGRIQLSAERTLRLVQGLTINHRVQQQDNQLALGFSLEPLNMAHMCEEVLHELTPFAVAYQQTMHLTVPRRPQLVVANRELLRSVCFNLIDNAIRHSPPEGDILVTVRRHAQLVRTCVQDTGPAMLLRDIQRLKQTIGRELQPLHGHAHTSGLGLYIATQLAHSMGGAIGLGSGHRGFDLHLDLQHSNQLSFL